MKVFLQQPLRVLTAIGKAVAMTAVAGLMIVSCKPDEPKNKEKTVQITFDQTEYYPFDAVVIQLSEKAIAQEYEGLVGTSAVTAMRISDSTLVVMLPDLVATEYTLSLKIGDARAEGKLKVKALPTVENPDAVIEEIKTQFAEILAEATQNSDANAALLTALAEVFNEQIARLTPAERQQFAAYWKAHPDDELEAYLKGYGDDKERALREMSRQAKIQIAKVTRDINIFAVVLPFVPATGLFGVLPATIAVCSFISGVYNFVKLLTIHETLTSYIFVAIKESIGLKRATAYDYVLSNGQTQTFRPAIDYRSVTADDISGTSSAAKELISTLGSFLSIWDNIQGGIDKLRNYTSRLVPALGARPQEVSDIKNPHSTESVPLENWTLQIVSGNVTAQKTGNDTYKFTTTATEDVEFTFKITAEGIETEVYTALLEVEEEGEVSPLVGVWRHYKTVFTSTVCNEFTGIHYPKTEEVSASGIYTFYSDGRLYPSPPYVNTPTYDNNAVYSLCSDGSICETWKLEFQSNTDIFIFAPRGGSWCTEVPAYVYHYFEKIDE